MRLLCALCLVAAVCAGCSNSSTGPSEAEDSYPTRTSPEHVIQKLSEAYEAMDADAYLDCLASDFEFHLALADIENDPSLPGFWGLSAEEAIHRLMFQDGNTVPVPAELAVDHITLALTVMTQQWEQGQDPQDPADDIWTYLVSPDLRLYFPAGLQRHVDSDVEFLFRVDRDQVGPEGETLYEIVRWNDLAQNGNRVEDATWTGVKLLFH